jgi:hypothetical protein
MQRNVCISNLRCNKISTGDEAAVHEKIQRDPASACLWIQGIKIHEIHKSFVRLQQRGDSGSSFGRIVHFITPLTIFLSCELSPQVSPIALWSCSSETEIVEIEKTSLIMKSGRRDKMITQIAKRSQTGS